MTDYSKSKIYKISSPNTERVYIGSTVRALNERFLGHCHKHSTTRANEIIMLGGAKIELIEDYPCDSKEKLLLREYEIIQKTQNAVNYYGKERCEFKSEELLSHWLSSGLEAGENDVPITKIKKELDSKCLNFGQNKKGFNTVLVEKLKTLGYTVKGRICKGEGTVKNCQIKG